MKNKFQDYCLSSLFLFNEKIRMTQAMFKILIIGLVLYITKWFN